MENEIVEDVGGETGSAENKKQTNYSLIDTLA